MQSSPQLPLEILLHITNFLDIPEIILLSYVNKEVHAMIKDTSEYRMVVTTIRSHHIRSVNLTRRRRRLSVYFHMPGRVIKQAINAVYNDKFADFNKKVIDFYVSRLLSGVTLRFQCENYLGMLCEELMRNSIFDSAEAILDSGLLPEDKHGELMSLYRDYKWSEEAELGFFL